MTIKKTVRSITVWECRCERCGYAWESKGEEPPAACAGCKQRHWNTPPGTLKRGRRWPAKRTRS